MAGYDDTYINSLVEKDRVHRSVYTDPEIFELGMITGQFIGYGRLISILDLENPNQPEARRHEHDLVK